MVKHRFLLALFAAIVLVNVYTVRCFAEFPSTNHWDSLSEAGWNCVNRSNGQATIDSGTNTPDPGNALKFTFPAGWVAGGEPAHCWNMYGAAKSEVWVLFYFKFSSNYYWNSVRNKIAYQWIGPDSGNNHFIGLQGSRHVVWEMQGAESRLMGSNTGYDPRIEAGQWYKIKMHAVINTPGVGDGTAEIWVNDQKLMRYSDVMFRSGNEGGMGFDELTFTPVFGGMSGEVKPAADYLWIDHVVISSTDPGGGPGLYSKVPSPPTLLKIE